MNWIIFRFLLHLLKIQYWQKFKPFQTLYRSWVVAGLWGLRYIGQWATDLLHLPAIKAFLLLLTHFYIKVKGRYFSNTHPVSESWTVFERISLLEKKKKHSKPYYTFVCPTSFILFCQILCNRELTFISFNDRAFETEPENPHTEQTWFFSHSHLLYFNKSAKSVPLELVHV